MNLPRLGLPAAAPWLAIAAMVVLYVAAVPFSITHLDLARDVGIAMDVVEGRAPLSPLHGAARRVAAVGGPGLRGRVSRAVGDRRELKVVNTIREAPGVASAGLAVMAAGVPMYWWVKRTARPQA